MKNNIAKLYSEYGEGEWERLTKDAFHRLEFDTTLRFLKKHLPAEGLILDAGGGPGRYTIELAQSGYDVVLLDLTPKLLEIAKREIKKTGVEKKVKQVVEGSIVDLSLFEDEKFDAVLCLGGPISHLKTEEERKKAIKELARVVKKDASVFISVMGKLGMLIETPMYWPDEMVINEHFRQLWQDGDDNLWKKTGFAHFFVADEFESLVESSGDLKVIECVGLEGLAHDKVKLSELAISYSDAWNNWLVMHGKMCTDPAVFASSDHMLIVAKKT